MITLRALQDVGFNELFEAFDNAFKDYEFQIGKDRLANLLQRRGYDPALSFGAFDDGKLVAFTLNGTGTWNGHPTAYDTGTGTTVDYRGQGLAGKIFDHAAPILKSAGYTHYLLEVLTNNTRAYRIYYKIGFGIIRELDYYFADIQNIRLDNDRLNKEVEIRPLPLTELSNLSRFCDFEPSWQNSTASVLRKPEDFTFLGAFLKDKITGYILFVSDTGELVQIGVDKAYRRQGIGRKMFQELLTSTSNSTLKVINVEKTCKSLPGFLSTTGMIVISSQYEMIKIL